MLIWCYGAATAEKEEINLPREGDGLVFTPVGSVVTAGNEYIIPLRLEAAEIYSAAHDLVLRVRNISSILKSRATDDTEYVSDLANNFVEEFEVTLKALWESLHHHLATPEDFNYDRRRKTHKGKGREKRGAAALGLVALGGLATGAYFGYQYNSDKVNEIHDILTGLKSDAETSFDEINLHSEILNITSSQTLENKESIEELKAAHNKTIDLIRQLMNDVLGLQVIQKAHGILIHLQLALSSFREECRLLDRALSDLFNGYIHPYVLTNDNFFSLLQSIEKPNHKLIFPISKSNIRLFREVTAVTYRYTKVNGTVFFYFMVPLQSYPPIKYNTYSITVNPIAYNQSDGRADPIFITINVQNQFISVSEDNKFYTLHSSLNNCKNYGNLYICPPTSAIYNSEMPTCESSIFFKTRHYKDLCNFSLQRKLFPSFTLLHDKWLYMIKPNMTLLIRCSNRPQPIDPVVLTNSSGILKLPDSCAATGTSLHLPSSSLSIGKTAELFSNSFNKSSSYLRSSKLLGEATGVYNTLSNMYVRQEEHNNFKINTDLIPLVRKLEIIHSKTANIPIPVDHFMYTISVAVALLFVFQVGAWLQKRDVCRPSCSRVREEATGAYCIRRPRNNHGSLGTVEMQEDTRRYKRGKEDAISKLRRIASESTM